MQQALLPHFRYAVRYSAAIMIPNQIPIPKPKGNIIGDHDRIDSVLRINNTPAYHLRIGDENISFSHKGSTDTIVLIDQIRLLDGRNVLFQIRAQLKWLHAVDQLVYTIHHHVIARPTKCNFILLALHEMHHLRQYGIGV